MNSNPEPSTYFISSIQAQKTKLTVQISCAHPLVSGEAEQEAQKRP